MEPLSAVQIKGNIAEVKSHLQSLTVAYGRLRVLKEIVIITQKRYAQKKKENLKLKTFVRELRSEYHEASEALQTMMQKNEALQLANHELKRALNVKEVPKECKKALQKLKKLQEDNKGLRGRIKELEAAIPSSRVSDILRYELTILCREIREKQVELSAEAESIVTKRLPLLDSDYMRISSKSTGSRAWQKKKPFESAGKSEKRLPVDENSQVIRITEEDLQQEIRELEEAKKRKTDATGAKTDENGPEADVDGPKADVAFMSDSDDDEAQTADDLQEPIPPVSPPNKRPCQTAETSAPRVLPAPPVIGRKSAPPASSMPLFSPERKKKVPPRKTNLSVKSPKKTKPFVPTSLPLEAKRKRGRPTKLGASKDDPQSLPSLLVEALHSPKSQKSTSVPSHESPPESKKKKISSDFEPPKSLESERKKISSDVEASKSKPERKETSSKLQESKLVLQPGEREIPSDFEITEDDFLAAQIEVIFEALIKPPDKLCPFLNSPAPPSTEEGDEMVPSGRVCRLQSLGFEISPELSVEFDQFDQKELKSPVDESSTEGVFGEQGKAKRKVSDSEAEAVNSQPVIAEELAISMPMLTDETEDKSRLVVPPAKNTVPGLLSQRSAEEEFAITMPVLTTAETTEKSGSVVPPAKKPVPRPPRQKNPPETPKEELFTRKRTMGTKLRLGKRKLDEEKTEVPKNPAVNEPDVPAGLPTLAFIEELVGFPVPLKKRQRLSHLSTKMKEKEMPKKPEADASSRNQGIEKGGQEKVREIGPANDVGEIGGEKADTESDQGKDTPDFAQVKATAEVGEVKTIIEDGLKIDEATAETLQGERINEIVTELREVEVPARTGDKKAAEEITKKHGFVDLKQVMSGKSVEDEILKISVRETSYKADKKIADKTDKKVYDEADKRVTDEKDKPTDRADKNFADKEDKIAALSPTEMILQISQKNTQDSFTKKYSRTSLVKTRNSINESIPSNPISPPESVLSPDSLLPPVWEGPEWEANKGRIKESADTPPSSPVGSSEMTLNRAMECTETTSGTEGIKLSTKERKPSAKALKDIKELFEGAPPSTTKSTTVMWRKVTGEDLKKKRISLIQSSSSQESDSGTEATSTKESGEGLLSKYCPPPSPPFELKKEMAKLMLLRGKRIKLIATSSSDSDSFNLLDEESADSWVDEWRRCPEKTEDGKSEVPDEIVEDEIVEEWRSQSRKLEGKDPEGRAPLERQEQVSGSEGSSRDDDSERERSVSSKKRRRFRKRLPPVSTRRRGKGVRRQAAMTVGPSEESSSEEEERPRGGRGPPRNPLPPEQPPELPLPFIQINTPSSSPCTGGSAEERAQEDTGISLLLTKTRDEELVKSSPPEKSKQTEVVEETASQEIEVGAGEGKRKDEIEVGAKEGKRKEEIEVGAGEGKKKDEMGVGAGEGKKKDEMGVGAGEGKKKDEMELDAGEGKKKDEMELDAGEGKKKDEMELDAGEGKKKDEMELDAGEGKKKDDGAVQEEKGIQNADIATHLPEEISSLTNVVLRGKTAQLALPDQEEGQTRTELEEKTAPQFEAALSSSDEDGGLKIDVGAESETEDLPLGPVEVQETVPVEVQETVPVEVKETVPPVLPSIPLPTPIAQKADGELLPLLRPQVEMSKSALVLESVRRHSSRPPQVSFPETPKAAAVGAAEALAPFLQLVGGCGEEMLLNPAFKRHMDAKCWEVLNFSAKSAVNAQAVASRLAAILLEFEGSGDDQHPGNRLVKMLSKYLLPNALAKDTLAKAFQELVKQRILSGFLQNQKLNSSLIAVFFEVFQAQELQGQAMSMLLALSLLPVPVNQVFELLATAIRSFPSLGQASHLSNALVSIVSSREEEGAKKLEKELSLQGVDDNGQDIEYRTREVVRDVALTGNPTSVLSLIVLCRFLTESQIQNFVLPPLCIPKGKPARAIVKVSLSARMGQLEQDEGLQNLKDVLRCYQELCSSEDVVSSFMAKLLAEALHPALQSGKMNSVDLSSDPPESKVDVQPSAPSFGFYS
ncbi:unnamed protein product [Cyprideis torosa]|uniref:Uncharacterized protein n=1 Tax=Cyprideis torosa TaxID=163714 RepID=A0A7R8W8X8_9CRUS|nr:unnamed protein product [Cyprideis torosa]CAG0889121.1 unnamed protein product [Cyprideis torosa]